MILRVGLTGGIGSGKSTVAALFKVLSIPVFDSDDWAKKLMNSDETLISALKSAFGRGVYEDGTLNRSLLAQRVFANRRELSKLNALVHPAVARSFDQWSSRQDAPYLIKEAAILFESGSDRSCDKTIAVIAPKALRMKRVMERDGIGREAVLSRMNNQWSDDKISKLVDYVVNNDGHEVLISQVMKIHEELTIPN
jgi:dephospho-CoA kinase